MPWVETDAVEQRGEFVREVQLGVYPVTELCARYGISRKTGYKWLARFAAGGARALGDRSRAPHRSPQRIAMATAELICAARRAHPMWGPEKLLDWLAARHPEFVRPAISTAGDLLARRGLVKRRRRRRRYPHPGVVPPLTTAPNDLWTADFKGHFRTRDRLYCYPLTVADQHTRYLLACHALPSTRVAGVQPVFERLFREHGLPRAIRTDNGVPFANNGLHGLTQLNVWWIRLGIQHQRIRPAQPQENGTHERMHKTLKYEATRPPRAHLHAQHRALQAFRRVYNEERPHQALGGRPPAALYDDSPRPYPRPLAPIEYPGHFEVRPVHSTGNIIFKKRPLFVSKALVHLPLGLEEVADGLWAVHFCQTRLAHVDERDRVLQP
jgi:transposase InsO family protein